MTLYKIIENIETLTFFNFLEPYFRLPSENIPQVLALRTDTTEEYDSLLIFRVK